MLRQASCHLLAWASALGPLPPLARLAPSRPFCLPAAHVVNRHSPPPCIRSERFVARPYPGAVPGSAADHGGTVVMQGQIRGEMERIQLARELDVRAAFAGLPRVNAQWSHR